jgi:lipid A 3-O-deacylase
MRRAALALLVIGMCVGARAQGIPEDGGRELGVWVAGGHSVPGGTKDTGVMDAGFRYGWILTKPHLPGVLRGTFEYAVDAIPLYLVMHDGATYGAGFNPLVLKWNFVGGRKVAPFVELAGGTLFTTHDVPRFTSAVNFRSGAALGIHILGKKWGPTLAIRYEHISNAGLASPNPGINTVQVQVAITRFGKP